MESLSLPQARKLVLLSQQLPPKSPKGTALSATLSAIENLSYIQIDTISVVQRAHHHTLWNRNPRYEPSHLDQLLTNKSIFEYWSHAAAYLPMSDYRFSLQRKQAIKDGRQTHWYKRDFKLMDEVLQRIESEGPLMAKDFTKEAVENNRKNSQEPKKATKDWKSNPAKKALESLFIQGDLMISERRNFHKVYDLTERVLPQGMDTTIPTDNDFARFLVTRFLQANAVGNTAEMTYLLKNIKPVVSVVLNEMCENSDVIPVNINGLQYYTLPDTLALLSKPHPKRKAKILSPFDNLLIQRKRASALFDFDYLLECYIPSAKRQFGYFCLPVLWDGKLVARVDCKVNKKTSALDVLHLALEPKLIKVDAFFSALNQELLEFAKFNGCETFQIHKISP